MFAFLKASPPIPRIDASRTDAEYRKLRWQVFAGVFIGYAAYYKLSIKRPHFMYQVRAFFSMFFISPSSIYHRFIDFIVMLELANYFNAIIDPKLKHWNHSST